MALLGVFINGCSSRSNNACVDVTLGQVHLKVPQQNMTPTTPHKDNSGNFIFAFDSSVPGIECVGWCNDLFVNISSTNPTPEQNWIYREPKFTGRTSGNYRVYLDRITNIYDPLWEILVPSDALHPQDEYYVCDPEGQGLKSRGVNPLCTITVVTKSGLVARFSIRRKVLIKAREAASFVIQSIDQFSENHIKGICK
jgi:hypothetical protein